MNSKNIVTLKESSAPALRPFGPRGRVSEYLFGLAPALCRDGFLKFTLTRRINMK
jgi:hypothetical protein